MTKKKVSGQTVAIIILAVLLVSAIIFGGVYAFYSTSTNKVSGKIVMANLSIQFKETGEGESGSSEILISNANNIVPNELLENTPLIVTNNSNTPIYLAVVYCIRAESNETGEAVVDVMTDGKKIIDVGADLEGSDWSDYVFTSNKSGTNNTMRCLITVVPQTAQEITVIADNRLKLHKDMNNDYQNCQLAFTFQAYAIGADSFQFSNTTTKTEKCETIMSAIYEAFEYKITI